MKDGSMRPLDQPHPKALADKMDFIERRLGTIGAVRGLGYTHSTKSMSEGPPLSAYKTLETMIDKMNGQLSSDIAFEELMLEPSLQVLFAHTSYLT